MAPQGKDAPFLKSGFTPDSELLVVPAIFNMIVIVIPLLLVLLGCLPRMRWMDRFIFTSNFTSFTNKWYWRLPLFGIPLVILLMSLTEVIRDDLRTVGADLPFESQLPPELKGKGGVPEICSTGTYALTRNPAYVIADPVCFFSLAVILDSLWPGVVSMPAFGLYAHFVVIPAEEGFLRREFGELFQEYGKKVPRYLDFENTVEWIRVRIADGRLSLGNITKWFVEKWFSGGGKEGSSEEL